MEAAIGPCLMRPDTQQKGRNSSGPGGDQPGIQHCQARQAPSLWQTPSAHKGKAWLSSDLTYGRLYDGGSGIPVKQGCYRHHFDQKG